MSKGFLFSIVVVLCLVAPMVERMGSVSGVLGGIGAPRRTTVDHPVATSRRTNGERAVAPSKLRAQKPPKRTPLAHTDYQLAAGTVVAVKLGNTVRSASSSTGDQVDAQLTEPLVRDGVELIPSGSLLHGTVVDALAASPRELRGRVAIAFFVIEHAGTNSRASIKTRTIAVDAPPRTDKQPSDVELTAGHALNVVLIEPLLVRIPK